MRPSTKLSMRKIKDQSLRTGPGADGYVEVRRHEPRELRPARGRSRCELRHAEHSQPRLRSKSKTAGQVKFKQSSTPLKAHLEAAHGNTAQPLSLHTQFHVHGPACIRWPGWTALGRSCSVSMTGPNQTPSDSASSTRFHMHAAPRAPDTAAPPSCPGPGRHGRRRAAPRGTPSAAARPETKAPRPLQQQTQG